ncbi:MAG: cache domain-containing protein [Desulfobacterales bacterium]|nr:cache domain-containing protein [Desulfobacteraceae bacterium]MDH3826179.1 cache domain-containing protein [Desulfobacterales bacterium]
MKKFTKVLGSMLSILAAFYFVNPCFAQERTTKEECVAKVEGATKLVKKIGLQPALEKFMDKSGPYNWKDSYVFCMEDGMGKLLAHPISRFIGFPMKNYKDADGKHPFAKVLEEINTKKKGWVEYYYRPAGADVPKLKKTYFLKIPGEKAILCAGYYE